MFFNERGADMRIGLVQMNIGQEKEVNLAFAEAAIDRLASERADLICLPETFNYLAGEEEMRENAEPLDGPSLSRLREKARERGVNVHCGSILERRGTEVYNTSVVFDRRGEQIAAYSKIHLFDVEISGGVVYRESDVVSPGSKVAVFDCEGVSVGLSICYDLRFPELYRSLADRGAPLVLVPAVFTLMTGKDHWEVLVRARAIENQCYVAAIGNWGWCPPKYTSWGHSMVVNPWGTILVQAADCATTLCCELDMDLLRAVREKLPALRHRKGDLFA